MRVKDSDLWWTPPELVELVKLIAPHFVDLFGSPGSPLSNAAIEVVDDGDDAFDPETDVSPRLALVANPPWSQGWLRKVVRELLRRQSEADPGTAVILIAPMRLETAWVREFDPSYILIPPGRIAYVDPATGTRPGSPRTSSCVYLRGDLNGLARMWIREHRWTIYTQHTLKGVA